jgi:Tfp pilus assembly protein PilF
MEEKTGVQADDLEMASTLMKLGVAYLEGGKSKMANDNLKRAQVKFSKMEHPDTGAVMKFKKRLEGPEKIKPSQGIARFFKKH